MTFISLTIHPAGHDPVTMSAEPVSAHFAIAPALALRTDGSIGLADYGRVLKHIPTGCTITHASWIDLRRYAEELEALPIDWSAITPAGLTDEQGEQVREAFDRASIDRSESQWPWPAWAGDESQPALSLLGVQLDSALKFDQRLDAQRDLERKVFALDKTLGKNVADELMIAHIGEHVRAYGVIYLLAVLHRTDPVAADKAARGLIGAWEDGSSLDEWIHQWRRELAEGVPLTLHEHPDLPRAAGRGDAA
ncbi:hypothetical protein [Nocardia wallacei]|uniref:hypothetical protein n=1 Tax=Nocardia wallacei TaxID=480035 RepID=UPI002458E7DF|nr:hypothetical protein [Nocardia wallacei]